MTDELRKRITDTIARGRVMLFMKGNPAMPQCGFSAAVVGMLKEVGVPFDPNRHEALQRVEVEGSDPGTVVS